MSDELLQQLRNELFHVTAVNPRLCALPILLFHQMEALNLSIKDLAKGTGISYEHARQIYRGDTLPSSRLIERLALVLKISEEQIAHSAKQDRTARKVRVLLGHGANEHPDLAAMQEFWTVLELYQKQDLIYLAGRWAAHNKQVPKKEEAPR